MPLQMNTDATERPQRIVWDKDKPAEAKEAEARCKALAARGFLLRAKEPGCALYDPPPLLAETDLLLRILSENGDDRIVWDRRDANQVREAAAKFKELSSKGYTLYAVQAGGKKGHKIDVFDPALEEVLASKDLKHVTAVPKTMPG